MKLGLHDKIEAFNEHHMEKYREVVTKFSLRLHPCSVTRLQGNTDNQSLSNSDLPNVQFGRTVRPNFYCVVRPK